jgi:ankyrin repeat protein
VAAAEGYLDCCQVLVNAGAAVNAQDAQEDTPLILASLHGHLPIVRFLLSNHAAIRKRGHHERTALHCAAEGGHLSLCRYGVFDFHNNGKLLEKEQI